MALLPTCMIFQDLLLYLLQLVQALKYEDFEEIKSGLDDTAPPQRRDSVGRADSPGPLDKERYEFHCKMYCSLPLVWKKKFKKGCHFPVDSLICFLPHSVRW